ncbi:MAG: hypothetical protein QOF97_2017, partial [Acidimicrobiaceae bacterium]
EGDVANRSYIATEAIVAVVEREALQRPVLLAVDDVHWADTATVLALRVLHRRLSDLPLAVVVAYRPHSADSAEIGDAVAEWQEGGASTILLGPLADDAIEELIADTLGATPGPKLRAEIDGANGNPLFVLELLRGAQAEGLVDRDGDVAELAAAGLPVSLRDAILRRLSAFPTETMQLLRLAAILGSAFDPADLAAVSGRSLVQLLDALHSAVKVGVLDSGDGPDARLRFRHDLIRAAIYEDVSPALRRGLHAEAARALDSSGAPPARVAVHLALGEAARDSDGLDLLLRVGLACRTSAPANAIELLERAITVTTPDDSRHDRAVAGLLPALVTQGRLEQAEHLARATLERDHDPSLNRWVLGALAWSLLRQGQSAILAQEMERLAATPGLSDSDRLVLRSRLASGRLLSGDVEGAGTEADAALADARRTGDDEGARMLLPTMSWIDLARGKVAAAIDHATEAVTLERLPGRGDAPYLYLGGALLEADRLDEAKAAFQQGRRDDLDAGDVSVTTSYHWALLISEYLFGQWDQAETEAEAAADLVAEGLGGTQGILFHHALSARIALHRDDLSKAATHLAEGEAELVARGPQIGIDFLLWAKALLLSANGEQEQALMTLEMGWSATAGIRYFLSWRTVAPDLIRMAVDAGRVDLAAAVLAEVEEGARRAEDVTSARAAALRCRGIITDEAELLSHAAALFTSAGRAVDAAYSAEDAGSAFARSGELEEAGRVLTLAWSAFDRLGATRDATRVRSRLREVGIHRRPRSQRTSARTGWDSLTPTEIAVVRLVAEGMTNPEIGRRLFISHHTVGTHLKHVFGKLGVSSRVELAAQAVRRMV